MLRTSTLLTYLPYVQIDQSILMSGAIGGSLTAIRLMKGITKHLLPSDLGEDFEVMVDIHIESNASLLHSHCEEVAISDDRYNQFIKGFNNALPLFNITVVGPKSKERVRKVEGLTYLFRSIPSCMLI